MYMYLTAVGAPTCISLWSTPSSRYKLISVSRAQKKDTRGPAVSHTHDMLRLTSCDQHAAAQSRSILGHAGGCACVHAHLPAVRVPDRRALVR